MSDAAKCEVPHALMHGISKCFTLELERRDIIRELAWHCKEIKSSNEGIDTNVLLQDQTKSAVLCC